MRNDGFRIGVTAAGALALVGTLLLALFDWVTAITLALALLLGWASVVAFAVGATIYRRHRAVMLGAGAVIAIVLLVMLRPDGSREATSTAPSLVSAYGAELWPNRLSSDGAFILRERVETAAGEASDGRADVRPIATGPFMRELRFAPGAGSALGSLDLAEDGEATIVVNPIENAEVHHARAGALSRVQLPIGPVVRIELGRLPAEARVAYLVGSGRTLAPLASLVSPLRRMPRVLVFILFLLIGAAFARAWADRLVTPVGRRFGDRPRPSTATPGRPAGPIERAPLVPRRK